MKNSWNVKKVVIVVLLGLLILTGGVLTLIGGTRALGLGRMSGQPGQFSNSRPEGMTLPDGMTPPEGERFTPGDGMVAPPSGFDMGQAGGSTNRPQGFVNGGRNDTQMKLLRLGQYALGGSVVFFGLLAAIGIGLDKKWGKVMTVIAAAIVLVAAIISLFQIRFSLTLIEAVVKIVISTGLILLTFLPSKKSQMEVQTA